MAFLGSNITSEVGLRLLLSPLGSNIVVRTSCCTVGVVLPVYSTFKAIERKNQNEQQKWLIYWAAYGSLSLAEVFADKLLSWVPMYYHVKFAFLVWLQLPSANGAQQLYSNHLRPFFLRHQDRVDLLVGFAYGEMVGLRLLLSPLGSNIVVRPSCCTVGVVLPVYSTFKAIERKNQNEQQKWLIYWAAYGSLSLAEVFADKLLSWVPMYYHVKFAFLVWLQLPSANGAQQLYSNHLRPFFLRHQDRVDLLVGFAYGEMVRIVSRHQAEIEFAKSILSKFIGPADHMRNGESDQSGDHPAIENETSVTTHIEADLRAFEQDARTITDTESDHDD